MTNSQNNKVVVVENLAIGYESVVLLENINFTVSKGEIFVILGGSGCGKTTLLKHLIGLYAPFRGDILIKGESIVKADWIKKREIMKNFGVSYQSGALFSSLTLEENIALPIEEYTPLPRELVTSVVNEKLSVVGLDGYGGYLPSEISGGMKKRAGLARAMALNPDLLFFDEPSAGLDPVSAARLDRLILSIRKNQGTTMIIVTHELDSIFTIADRVIMLDKRKKGIIASGNPHELRKSTREPWVSEFLTRSGLSHRGAAD